MNGILISGGNIDQDFALDFLEKQKGARIIAVDRGMEFCHANQIEIDAVVGDFDSVKEEALSYYRAKNVPIKQLRPEKDDSDTESAFHLAVEMGITRIFVLGATGTRLDHVWANLSLLAHAGQMGVEMSLWDTHNYISVRFESFHLKRSEQFGKYVSFFSLGDHVPDLTLQGFKYPLNRHDLKNTDSGLTVSNEIIEDDASVTFGSGILVMIQSSD